MANKQQPHKVPPLGKMLLYGAATYQATQYASASALVHGGETPLNVAGGLVAGMVVNFSLAYAATKLPELDAKAERYENKGKAAKEATYARVAFYGLLVVSPLLIAPANYLLLDKTALAGIWWLQVPWAVLWASAMDIAIAMVGFIDKSLISVEITKGTGARAGNAPGVRAHSTRTPAHSADSAGALRAQCAALALQYACSAPGCGWKPDIERLIISKNPAGSASAMKAGHTKNQHAPVPVDQTLLLQSGQERKP